MWYLDNEGELASSVRMLISQKVGPPMNPTTVAFDELRLGPDGRPISLVTLLTVPARDGHRRKPQTEGPNSQMLNRATIGVIGG